MWSLIVFIALSSGKNLPHSENWNNIFNSLGQKYRIPDIHLAFKSYLFSQFIAAALIAIGIIFSWRKKISGYHLLFTGIAIALSGALILLGFDYVQNECGWWEFTSGGVVCVLFLLYFLTFKKSN